MPSAPQVRSQISPRFNAKKSSGHRFADPDLALPAALLRAPPAARAEPGSRNRTVAAAKAPPRLMCRRRRRFRRVL